jgi:hypothetical protein
MEKILIVLKLIWFFVTRWAESDRKKKEKKERLINEMSKAIETNDISRVNALLNDAGRL